MWLPGNFFEYVASEATGRDRVAISESLKQQRQRLTAYSMRRLRPLEYTKLGINFIVNKFFFVFKKIVIVSLGSTNTP
jgi:hypothetical protein